VIGGNGTLAVTEDSDTLSAQSTVALKAAAALTEAGDTLAAQAALALTATASITEADDTLSATQTATEPPAEPLGGTPRMVSTSRKAVRLFEEYEDRLRNAVKKLRKKARKYETPADVEIALEHVAKLTNEIVVTRAAHEGAGELIALLRSIDAAIEAKRIQTVLRQSQEAAEHAHRILQDTQRRIRRKKDDEDALLALLLA
jgi:hypothetical protein